MATTLFHWTLHPWAIYAVVGLAISYGVYRKGRMQLISSAFEPLLGSRANGPAGKVIDMLAITLALFVFIVSPTIFILNLLPTTVGSYLAELPMMSARTGAEGAEVDTWLQSWTIFYWAWWVSWTPFVGMFIARISRGRTIRQFVAGVLLVPSLVSLVWFCVFGGAAINVQQGGTDLAGEGSIEEQLFGLLDQYPIATIASVLVMVLVATFFVSGADAASIVMGSLSERGTIEPSRGTVIFWGIAMGAVAAVMLLVGGEDALTGLQTITIIAALPFLLVMIGMAVALVKDLCNDPMMVRKQFAADAVDSAVISGVTRHGDDVVISVEEDPDKSQG
jgi:choline-glycine betaine transporter